MEKRRCYLTRARKTSSSSAISKSGNFLLVDRQTRQVHREQVTELHRDIANFCRTWRPPNAQ
jgi:hypothetical protein